MACVVLVLVRHRVLGVLIVYCKRVVVSGPVSEVPRTSEVAVVCRRQVPLKVAGGAGGLGRSQSHVDRSVCCAVLCGARTGWLALYLGRVARAKCSTKAGLKSGVLQHGMQETRERSWRASSWGHE